MKRRHNTSRSVVRAAQQGVSFAMSPDHFIRTDTAEDAVSSFELASIFLLQAQSDLRYWKWFILACHAGVQGTFALALEGGNGLLVQKAGVMQKTLAAFASHVTPPLPHMDNFTRLYKKVQVGEHLRSSDVRPVSATTESDAAISNLDELRDEYMHFNVKGWSIDLAVIRTSALECINVAAFLINQPGAVLWHEANHEHRAKAALSSLQAQLAQS